MTILWVNCPLWVSQPGQLSIPSFKDQQVSSNPYITRLVDLWGPFKRQTRDACGCMAVQVKVSLCWLERRPCLRP